MTPSTRELVRMNQCRSPKCEADLPQCPPQTRGQEKTQDQAMPWARWI